MLGVGFFLLNLIPILGFIYQGASTMVWSLDHLNYLPMIGLIGLIAAGFAKLDEKVVAPVRPWFLGSIAFILVILATGSRSYAQVFVSHEALWTYTLRENPNSEVAHHNLGTAYLDSGRYDEAIGQFQDALRIKPEYALAENGLGNALVFSNRASEAIEHYQAAVRIDPTYAEAHNGLANVLLQSGRLDEAKSECETALRLKPGYPEAHCNLGLVYAQQGNLADAIAQFEAAQELRPGDERIGKFLEQLRAQKAGAK